MNASVAIQTLPAAENDEELIRIVDEVIDYIKSTGLSYYVGPCETSVEGEYEELMEIVKNCQIVAAKAAQLKNTPQKLVLSSLLLTLCSALRLSACLVATVPPIG